ncbi:MAG: hypothetical protein AAF667_06685 [Pseudomonadota bacterium]
MVAHFFDECTANLLVITKNSKATTRRECVQFLIRSGLTHGQEISDKCRAFREIWAISSRNPVINEGLIKYYEGFAETLADFVLDGEPNQVGRARLKALLVPYFEGYLVTARSLSLDVDETAEMLTEMAMASVGSMTQE